MITMQARPDGQTYRLQTDGERVEHHGNSATIRPNERIGR